MWKQKGGSQCQTKIELRFMPCYSAITFQCSPYVCLLERAETHSGATGRRLSFRSSSVSANHTPFFLCCFAVRVKDKEAGQCQRDGLFVGLLL